MSFSHASEQLTVLPKLLAGFEGHFKFKAGKERGKRKEGR